MKGIFAASAAALLVSSGNASKQGFRPDSVQPTWGPDSVHSAAVTAPDSQWNVPSGETWTPYDWHSSWYQPSNPYSTEPIVWD